MRRCFFALVLSLVTSGQCCVAQRAKLLLPETKREVSVTLTKPVERGSFRTVTIVSNGRSVSLMPKNSVIQIPDGAGEKLARGVWTDIPGLKLHPSRCFLTGSYSIDSQSHTLLFFLGEAGIGAAPVFIVGFSDDGQPFKILDQTELDVTSLQPSPDGVFIVGKTSLSEVMAGDGGKGSKKPYATTYDPFSVYLVRPSGPAVYSLEASRAYNEKHYVWVGPHIREDYAVLYNMPGHPKLLGAPASKVSELLAHAGVR